jgi:hypothetical protein
VRGLVSLLALASACAAPVAGSRPESLDAGAGTRSEALDTIRAEDVQRHVDYLASDELGGRWSPSPEARLAADYVAAAFAAAGLEPLGDDGTWFQSIDDRLAPNVVGIERGTGPGYVLVTAHYDHLRPRGAGEDRIFNGADDNASGTAAVLEIAEAFGRLERATTASVVFVAFTAEEMGLRGSRFFVQHPPFGLDEIVGVVNLDMVSRGEENLIFCEGGPDAPELLAAAERANAVVGLEIRHDRHPEWLRQSDQWPFLQAGVRALYFGVEDHPDYHRVSDHADRILPVLTERVARLVFLILLDVAGGDVGNG